MGIFAHFASPTIFNQSIRPQHSAHTQSRTTQQANSSPISRPYVSEPLWVLSQLFIPDPTSPFSPLLTLILKPHIFFITVFHLSAMPHRTLAAALPRSWNWLLVFALGPVRCNMPNARDKASFLAAANGPGRLALFIGLTDEEWTLKICFQRQILHLWASIGTMLQCLFRRQLAYLSWE